MVSEAIENGQKMVKYAQNNRKFNDLTKEKKMDFFPYFTLCRNDNGINSSDFISR